MSFEFVELNVNLSARLLSDLRLAAQVLYRRNGNTQDEVDTDYLFLDYQPHSSAGSVYGFRLGRAKLPIGFFNETRDVAQTRPSIYLPQSIYSDVARDLSLSADGGFIYGQLFTDRGQWTLEMGLGKPRVDADTIGAFTNSLGIENIGNLNSEKVKVARLMYDHDGDRLRFALTYVDVVSDFGLSIPGFGMLDATAQVKESILSVQYQLEYWLFTSEYMVSDINLEIVPVLETPLDSVSYYLLASRQIAENWRLYARYDVNYRDKDDLSGKDYNRDLGGARHIAFTKDSVVGVRRFIGDNGMASLEYHYLDGASWLSAFDNPDAQAVDQYWNMLNLQFSYRF